MSVHTRRSDWVTTTAVSWRLLVQRFSFALFFVLSLGLLILSRNQTAFLEKARTGMMDGVAPIFDAVARPMMTLEQSLQNIQSYFRLYTENEKLRAENARLKQWQGAALALETENKELRALLKYKAEPSMAYISARVIADAGGPFVRSLLITAGEVDGVKEGMAAMAGDGLIGRVIEVGNWSSRILLITDMNSRIPVTLSGSGEHAILAGTNASELKLLYLAPDAVVEPGARILTSGHGGVFPPNLPVARIVGASGGGVDVEPLASLARINQIRLVDFTLAGGSFNPMAEKSGTDARRK